MADAQFNLDRWKEIKENPIVDKNPKSFGQFSINSGQYISDLSLKGIEDASKEIESQLSKSIKSETSVNTLELTILSDQKNDEVSRQSSRFQRIHQSTRNIVNKVKEKSQSLAQPFIEHPLVKSITKNVEFKMELNFPKNPANQMQNLETETPEKTKKTKTFLVTYPTLGNPPIEVERDQVPSAHLRTWVLPFYQQEPHGAVYVDVEVEEEKETSVEQLDQKEQQQDTKLEEPEKTRFSWAKNWMKKIRPNKNKNFNGE